MGRQYTSLTSAAGVSRALDGVMNSSWWQDRVPTEDPAQQNRGLYTLQPPEKALMLMGLDPPFLPNSPSTHPVPPMMVGQEYPREWRECPLCQHRWHDKYRKDECPKCLHSLSQSMKFYTRGGMRREPGETSTFKYPPGSAMVSEYGECHMGGAHLWKYGQCVKCGIGEGTALSQHYSALKGTSVAEVRPYSANGIPMLYQSQPHPFELADPKLMQAVQAYENAQNPSQKRSQTTSPVRSTSPRHGSMSHRAGMPSFFSASFASYGADLGVAALHPRIAPPAVPRMVSMDSERQAVGNELLRNECVALRTSHVASDHEQLHGQQVHGQQVHGQQVPQPGAKVEPEPSPYGLSVGRQQVLSTSQLEPSPSPSHMGSREWERGLGSVQLRPYLQPHRQQSGTLASMSFAMPSSKSTTPGAAPMTPAVKAATATAGTFMSGATRPWRLAGWGPNSEQVRLAATLSDSELRLMQARVQAGSSYFTSRGLPAELATRTPTPTRSASSTSLARSASSAMTSVATSVSRGQMAEIRRACPTCGHRWLDKYRKDECPKCLCRVSVHDSVQHCRSVLWDAAPGPKYRPTSARPIVSSTRPSLPHDPRNAPVSTAAEMAASMSLQLERLKREGREEDELMQVEARARAEGRDEAVVEIAQEIHEARAKFAAVRAASDSGIPHCGCLAAEQSVTAKSKYAGRPPSPVEQEQRRSAAELMREAEQRALYLAAELAKVQAQLDAGNFANGPFKEVEPSPEGGSEEEPPTRQPVTNQQLGLWRAEAVAEAAPTNAPINAPMSFATSRLAVAEEITEAAKHPTPHPQLQPAGWTYQQYADDLLQRSASASILELRRMEHRRGAAPHAASTWLSSGGGSSGNAALRASNLEHSRAGSPSKAHQRKQCPTCGHRWLDKYQKDECPKCLVPLSIAESRRNQRLPGEVSTFKQPPGSAMESASGVCPKGQGGQKHLWRFGRCTICGMAEGNALSRSRCVVNGSYIADVTAAGNVHWSVQMS